jgi:hypothetical protein
VDWNILENLGDKRGGYEAGNSKVGIEGRKENGGKFNFCFNSNFNYIDIDFLFCNQKYL